LPDGLRHLHLAGVDVLLDAASTAHLIEVNDRPLFGDSVAGDADGADPPPCQMAIDLVRHARTIGAGAVGIVLPDAFRVDGTGAVHTVPGPEWVVADDSAYVDDRRIGNVIFDLNMFCSSVVRHGLPALVMDTLVLDDPSLVGPVPADRSVVWNRTTLPAMAFARSVNDPAAAALCVDKLTSFRSWADLDEVIPTWRLGEVPMESASGRWVVKPRFGSGSRGLMRVEDLTATAGSGEDYIAQPWVEAATVVHNDRPYRFDLRVYVVGGTATTVLLRRCAAPVSHKFDDSPLSWLTTSGPMHLAIGDAEVEAPHVAGSGSAIMPERQLDSARVLAEQAVDRIERACVDAPSESAPPPFRSMHVVSGRLDRIRLRQEPIR
jgi:hypothetical protein